MNVPTKLMEKFITLCNDLSNNNKVRELIIFTSVEGTNKQRRIYKVRIKL